MARRSPPPSPRAAEPGPRVRRDRETTGTTLATAEARRRRALWRRMIAIVAVAALASAAFGVSISTSGAPVWHSALHGFVNGLLVVAPIIALELASREAAWTAPMRRLPFLPFIAIKSVLYLVALLAGTAIAREIFIGSGPVGGSTMFRPEILVFGTALSLLVNLALEFGHTKSPKD